MKKLISFFLIFCLLFLTSCSSIEIIELNERLIIEAIGIDYSDGKYQVTIEGLDSLTAGSESNSISSGKLTKCYMFEGNTIGMAMNSISQITGQIPLFSQARVLIIGFDTAKEKLSESLDFFRREYTTRTDILIAVAEKTASETVSANFGENVSAGNIFEAALSSYKHTGKSTYTPLYRFLNSLMGETDSAFCPLVGIKENDFSDSKEVSLKGTAVFNKGSEMLILSPEETLALMLINNDAENGDITVESDKGLCTFEIIDSKTKTKVVSEGNKKKLNISIKLICDIPEFQTDDFKDMSKTDIEKTAFSAADEVSGLVSGLLNTVYYKENCDIFSFGRKINLSDHYFYKNHILSDESYESNIDFDIKVTVSVRRIGKVILEKEIS